jgi:sulfonate transport system ATP-binding protein
VSTVEVKNLSKSFGNLLVLDNVTFDVDSGEFLCIVGPTGCGKTTFLNSLTKIYDIDSGSIKIDGEEVDLRRQSLTYIMQEYSTMSWLTVRQNVQFGLKVKKLKKTELESKTDAALELVGLSQFRDYYPNQLSASMMQRVSIARAFAVQPDLLLMDEPYGQLDLELRFKLEDELLSLWRKLGTTIIFITHNIEEAVYLSQRILVLTNKPTTIKENVVNDLSFPRKITGGDFIRLRNKVTELIKWW